MGAVAGILVRNELVTKKKDKKTYEQSIIINLKEQTRKKK